MPQHLFSFLLARIFGSILVCFDFGAVELFRLSYFSIYSICGVIQMQHKLHLSTARPNVLSSEFLWRSKQITFCCLCSFSTPQALCSAGTNTAGCVSGTSPAEPHSSYVHQISQWGIILICRGGTGTRHCKYMFIWLSWALLFFQVIRSKVLVLAGQPLAESSIRPFITALWFIHWMLVLLVLISEVLQKIQICP